MTNIQDLDDDALLARLGPTIRARTTPPRQVVATAKELFGWRAAAGELAGLTFDSLVDGAPPVFQPAAAPPRTLSFASASTVVHAALVALDGVRRLIGRVSPPRVAELELTTPDAFLRAPVDRNGRFSLVLPNPTTRIALRLLRCDGSSVRTAPLAV